MSPVTSAGSRLANEILRPVEGVVVGPIGLAVASAVVLLAAVVVWQVVRYLRRGPVRP